MTREWSWEPEGSYDQYTATATADGVSYMVFMSGPAGGPGMAGYQSYEQLLADGPLNDMPADIAREVRAHIEAIRRAEPRVQLAWTLEVESQLPANQDLAYVSAALDDKSILVRTVEANTVVLFDGSLPPGKVRLSVFVGFGRPWRQPGARSTEHDIDIVLVAGTPANVTSRIRPDLTVASSSS